MSEPELVAYMTGNEDFDLPRWQPHHYQDPLSSSAQAAQAAQQAVFAGSAYSAAPPPPPQSIPAAVTARQRPIINTHHPITAQPESARNPRLSHLFDSDQQLGHTYLSSGQAQLSRSASLGGSVGGAGAAGIGSGAFSARRNRHHMADDLESAYMNDGAQERATDRLQQHRQLAVAPQQTAQSFYPAGIQYNPTQQQMPGHSVNTNIAPSSAPAISDSYQSTHYAGASDQPRRHNTTTRVDESMSSRSPRRSQTGQVSSSPLLDPYSQIQQLTSQASSAYSPSATAYSYASPTEMPSASTYHPQSISQQPSVKVEASTSPLSSPFPGQRNLPPPPVQATSHYSHYPMDTSPGPSHSSQATPHHLSSQPMMPLRQTMSTPSTPLSYQHAQQSQGQYQTAMEDQMAIEVNPHKRRASGLKRIRDHRELRPYVNVQPAGRRGDANGQFLSVRRVFVYSRVLSPFVMIPAC